MTDLGLGSWPARRARIDPARPALRQADRVRSYAELADRVDRLAAALATSGVRAGDRVAYLGASEIATFETFFAAGRLGAIFVPLNTRLATPELAFLLADCAPAVLVHGADMAAAVAELRPGAEVPVWLAADDFDDLVAATPAPAPGPDGFAAFGVDVTLADPAVILYTSGTTGRPKGAVLTHGNLTFNTMNQLAHADVLSGDTAMSVAPLFHASGLGQVSLPTLFKGGCVVMLPRFDAAAVLAQIAELGIASFSGVPTILQMLCDHPDFESTDLSSLRYVIYGGSMVAERVAVAWQRRGVPLLQGYGMTEASPGVYMALGDGALERPVSIGVPHFFTDVTLRPLADGADGADGAEGTAGTGELLVRGPNVFGGYWQRPADTEQALEGGWYHSGDVVRVDPDGWAYVVDRLKDMIITGGENVYPAEVEAALNQLDGVHDSAVVAVPDERWGEVGTAFLMSDRTWTPAELRTALDGRLAAYKIPKHVQVVADLPRTAVGKILRQQLRAAAARSDSVAQS